MRESIHLPNLFIPGAQKSGTTTLADRLAQHPEICLGVTKELNVFGQNDEERRLGLFTKSFADRPERYRCDASVSYLYTPQSAVRISETVGSAARLVFLLRHPVDRAVSAYWHMVSHGQEDRSPAEVFDLGGSLDDVLAQEQAAAAAALQAGRIRFDADARRFPEPLNLFRYVWGSCYARHLVPYGERFDRQQMLFVFFDELTKDADGLVERVLEFLDLVPSGQGTTEAAGTPHARNVTYVPQRTVMGQVARAARSIVPSGLRNVLRSRWHAWYQRMAYARPETLDDRFRSRLQTAFQPELKTLETQIGRPLPGWWIAPNGD